MHMMLTIFGDQKCLSLLCYLDDLLVFAKSEEESLVGNGISMLERVLKLKLGKLSLKL